MCKELKVLGCPESGTEGLMNTEGLCNQSPEVEHTSEANKVTVLTVNYSIHVFLCDSLCLVLYKFFFST